MREPNGLHWVAARYYSRERIQVYDSLAAEPLLEGRDFMEEHILSALLIRPMEQKVQARRSGGAHVAGTLELKRSMIRYTDLMLGS